MSLTLAFVAVFIIGASFGCGIGAFAIGRSRPDREHDHAQVGAGQ